MRVQWPQQDKNIDVAKRVVILFFRELPRVEVVTPPFQSIRRSPQTVVGAHFPVVLVIVGATSSFRANFLGHKGLMATAFGALANEMWRTDKASIRPADFKAQVSASFVGNRLRVT